MNIGDRIASENEKAPTGSSRGEGEDGDTITELRDEQTTYSKTLSRGTSPGSSSPDKKGDSDSRGGTASSVPVYYGRQTSTESRKSGGDSELAKAVPVDDDGELTGVYDVASPVDPNKKPHRFYDNGAFLCCLSLMCCCVALAIIIVVVVVLTTSEGDKTIVAPTSPPTPAPTSLRDVAVTEELIRTLGPDKVTEPNTPYSTALEWLLHEDPLQLDEYADNLVQRYILILFYFQTSEQGPWVSCSPPENQNASATCSYYDVERNPDQSLSYYPRNETSIRWLSDRHECEWAQIECFNEEVVTMDVYGQNLTGTLPEELVHLTRLATLSLSLNQFIGPIPSVYGQMENLVILELTDNWLSGSIPLELWQHSGLLQFNPSYNFDLTGTIPTEIGLMTSLDSLFLFQTSINGTLPTEIGDLDWSLRSLVLYDNLLSGTIPSELFQLTLLEVLNLSGNYGLSGSLPSEVGQLSKALKYFSMARMDMGGTPIPEEFWQLNKLITIDMEESLLGGTLSPKIGNLTRLMGLRASRNEFTGTIPTTIGSLQNLQLLWLHLNDFSGSVPLSVCQLRGPDSLQFLSTDCGGSGIPRVPCQCCTACCDDAGTCQRVTS